MYTQQTIQCIQYSCIYGHNKRNAVVTYYNVIMQGTYSFSFCLGNIIIHRAKYTLLYSTLQSLSGVQHVFNGFKCFLQKAAVRTFIINSPFGLLNCCTLQEILRMITYDIVSVAKCLRLHTFHWLSQNCRLLKHKRSVHYHIKKIQHLENMFLNVY